MEVTVDPASYDRRATSWDKVGPFYDDDPIVSEGATHTHAWAANRGCYVYGFDWPGAPPGGAEISARLSSEHPWYSSPPNHFSDVTLVLNGRAHPSQRVVPDDGSGQVYTWQVDGGGLQTGRNELRFEVKGNAAYRNGLCIYHRAVVAGELDSPIRVRAVLG